MKTMCEEMDAWVLAHDKPAIKTASRLAPSEIPIPPCPLTDKEIDWLWPRYQKCSFPPATFAKRFAGTPRDKLTPRGKNAAVRLAFRYRRQILGRVAVKMAENEFLSAVRNLANK